MSARPWPAASMPQLAANSDSNPPATTSGPLQLPPPMPARDPTMQHVHQAHAMQTPIAHVADLASLPLGYYGTSAGLAAGGLLVPHSSSVQSNVVGAPGGPPSAPAHKPCKCKNSKCLKLYCECFSAGVMCSNCNCVGCLNNPAHEQARDEAIDQQLEKNPHAFKPKIASAHMLAKGATPSPAKPKRGWNQGTVDPAAGPDATPLDGQFMKVHNKGCNCKKSFCLKKYCECFQAGILCGEFCHCKDCKNFVGSRERDVMEAKGQVAPSPARVAHLHSHAHPHGGAAATHAANSAHANSATMPFQMKIHNHIAGFVPAHASPHPLGGVFTSDFIQQVAGHLIETAAHETKSSAAGPTPSEISDLLSLGSPQQPKMRHEEGEQKTPTAAAGGVKRTLFDNKDAHPPPQRSPSAIALLPRVGALPTVHEHAYHPPLLPAASPKRSPLAMPLAIPRPITPLASSSPDLLKRMLADAEAVAKASAASTSPSLVPATVPPASTSPSTAPMALTDTPTTAGAVVETTKRKREDDTEAPPPPAVDANAMQIDGALNEAPTGGSDQQPPVKRVKVEPTETSVAPAGEGAAPTTTAAATVAAATARPSSPTTAALMCEESELLALDPIPVPSPADLPPPPRTPSPEPTPTGHIYKQQEKAVLTEFASVVKRLAERATNSASGGRTPVAARPPQIATARGITASP